MSLFGVPIPGFSILENPVNVFPIDADFGIKRGRQWSTIVHRISPVLEWRVNTAQAAALTFTLGFSKMPGSLDNNMTRVWTLYQFFLSRRGRQFPFIYYDPVLWSWYPAVAATPAELIAQMQADISATTGTTSQWDYVFRQVLGGSAPILASSAPYGADQAITVDQYLVLRVVNGINTGKYDLNDYRGDPTTRILNAGGTAVTYLDQAVMEIESGGYTGIPDHDAETVVNFDKYTGRYIATFDTDEMSIERFDYLLNSAQLKLIAYPSTADDPGEVVVPS